MVYGIYMYMYIHLFLYLKHIDLHLHVHVILHHVEHVSTLGMCMHMVSQLDDSYMYICGDAQPLPHGPCSEARLTWLL